MKKWLEISLGVILTMTIATAAYAAAPQIKVYVNSSLVDFPDQQPYINEDSRTMVPIRFVAERLGAEVGWNDAARTATIKRSGEDIILKIGENKATVNSSTVTFDTAAVLTEQWRTMVPLRFISETLGADVQWVQAENTVYITDNYSASAANAEDDVLKQFELNGYHAPEGSYNGSRAREPVAGYMTPSGMIFDAEVKDEFVDFSIALPQYFPKDIYDLEGQQHELEDILSSSGKYSNQTVKEVIDYVKLKIDRWDDLDKSWQENGRTIRVGSDSGEIDIYVQIRKD